MRGNLVPDAHIAAILLQHGIRTLYTNDRDFLKFPSLDVRDPFACGFHYRSERLQQREQEAARRAVAAIGGSDAAQAVTAMIIPWWRYEL